VLLTPEAESTPVGLPNHATDPAVHERLLESVQQLRGTIYSSEGIIQPWQVAADGRHVAEEDARAWHLLGIDPQGAVCGCVRYLPHAREAVFSDLSVSRSLAAQAPEWGVAVRAAVEAEMELARSRGVVVVEIGGWAVAEEFRSRSMALKMALASFAMARYLGGCIGLGVATEGECASASLKRIGGRALDHQGVPLSRFEDPRSRRQMEMLRFDSAELNPRYADHVLELEETLRSIPVISASSSLLRLSRAVSVGRGASVAPKNDAAAPAHAPVMDVMDWETLR
jgi:hypothetical protein